MSSISMSSSSSLATSNVSAMATRARAAALQLAALSDKMRQDALIAAADAILADQEEIVAANRRDCERARAAIDNGSMSAALFKRLQTSEKGVCEMADRIKEVAALPDPLGRNLAVTVLDDRLVLHKVSCPLGVIAVVFEARPDVIPQIASLALRSGNAVLLKGGTEADETNACLMKVWTEALSSFPEIPADSAQLLRSREDVHQLLALHQAIDLIVPRGSNEFVNFISSNTRIPVLGHGEGICHVYVDRAADIEKAIAVTLDSKIDYPAACNSVETVLVHQEIAPLFVPKMLSAFSENGVQVRGCPRTLELAAGAELAPGIKIVPAGEKDWSTEYSDLIVSMKVVSSVDEAIAHINRFGSKHTESIVTEDADTASRFMDLVDAAGVYQNASTRFADGYRYGLGAEVGISTAKLHARGPVGLEGLTTYKYKLFGDGHIVAAYRRGERVFKHWRLDT
jgi:glutamate-5-semialdehyde dehydrogenase